MNLWNRIIQWYGFVILEILHTTYLCWPRFIIFPSNKYIHLSDLELCKMTVSADHNKGTWFEILKEDWQRYRASTAWVEPQLLRILSLVSEADKRVSRIFLSVTKNLGSYQNARFVIRTWLWQIISKFKYHIPIFPLKSMLFWQKRISSIVRFLRNVLPVKSGKFWKLLWIMTKL